MFRYKFSLFFFAVFLLTTGNAHTLLPKGQPPFHACAIDRAYVHSSVTNESESQSTRDSSSVEITPSLLKRGQGELSDNTFPKYYFPQTNSPQHPDKSIAENFAKQNSALSFIENRGQLVDTDCKVLPDI